MRIQYVSRLTAVAAAALRPVAPILVVAGGAVPLPGQWEHVISVAETSQKVVDATGLRFVTMPFDRGTSADFALLMRELEIARTDAVPVVCVTRGAPGFFLAGGGPTVLPHVRGLLCEPLRAWIVGETPVAMNVNWAAQGLFVKGGSNPFGAPGFCSEIFLDVSTDAVREVPVLAQLGQVRR